MTELHHTRETDQQSASSISAGKADSKGWEAWNGQRLRGGPVAITLLADHADGYMAAVAVESSAVFSLDRRGLTGFLLVHSGRRLICYDAATLHWELERTFAGAADLLNCLWRFSAQYRLRDVMLLDQRVRLAETGRFSPPRRLQDLREDYCREEIAICCPPHGQVLALLEIYRTLRRKAKRIFERAAPRAEPMPSMPAGGSLEIDFEKGISGSLPDLSGFDSTHYYTVRRRRKYRGDLIKSIRCFGPLGLGIDVQGAIAMRRAAQTGIQIDGQRAETVKQKSEQVYRESSRKLREGTGSAIPCFRWQGDVVKRDKDGSPKTTDQLQAWLRERLESNPDLRGAPRKPPRDSQGEISTRPDDWGLLTRCDRQLRAWADLHSAADASRFAHNDTIHPKYCVIPEIRLTSPNPDAVRRFAPESFVPRNGHTFLLGVFQDLELRCFASVRQRMAGLPTSFSEAFRDARANSPDPVDRAAANLYEAFTGQWEHDEIDEQIIARAREQGGSSWFAGFDSRTRTEITRQLIFGVCAGLSQGQIRELLRAECQLPRLPGEADIDLLVRLLLFSVCPEWQVLVEDPTIVALIDKLELSIAQYRRYIHLDDVGVTEPFAMRNVLLGRVSAPQIVERIKELAKASSSEEVREWAANLTGSREDYEQIATTNPVSLTGQVGSPVYCPQRSSAEGMLLADAVVKTAVYWLVRKGFPLVAVTSNSFLLEVPEESDAKADDVMRLANQAAEIVLDDMARGCCICYPTNRW